MAKRTEPVRPRWQKLARRAFRSLRSIRPARLAAHVVPAAVGLGLAFGGWLVAEATPSASRAVASVPARVASVAPTPHPSAAPPSVIADASVSAPRHSPEQVRVKGRFHTGDTLASALARHDLSSSVAYQVARHLRPVFDVRNVHAGDTFRATLTPDGSLVRFEIRLSPLEAYQLVRQGDSWTPSREEVQLVRKRTRIAGVVTTNLYDAIQDLGENPELASDFAGIFAWEFDFSKAVQTGDEFRILYERVYRVDDDGHLHYVGPGRILAARYRGADGVHTAVYFQTSPDQGGYYRPDGTSVRREFLVAPLRYTRISSRFSLARYNPILHIVRPHRGVDYAAPIGTPIWAVANGRVIFRGWDGGFGNLVKIRHANGYVSYYGHLSRYAKGLHVGETVHQKQVIGYVGETGLATGPHVHFGLEKHGHFINPLKLHSPAGKPIPADERQAFDTVRDSRLTKLGPSRIIATDEAM